MRKTIYSIGFLVIESVFSVGLFTSCGDQFQEEYPWLIGKQEEMDNNNEEGAGATDITVLEKELKGAIPFMINYSHEPTDRGRLTNINITGRTVLTTMQDTGRLPRVLLLSVVRCLRFILSPTIIWGALWITRFSHSLTMPFTTLPNWVNPNGVLWR